MNDSEMISRKATSYAKNLIVPTLALLVAIAVVLASNRYDPSVTQGQFTVEPTPTPEQIEEMSGSGGVSGAQDDDDSTHTPTPTPTATATPEPLASCGTGHTLTGRTQKVVDAIVNLTPASRC